MLNVMFAGDEGLGRYLDGQKEAGAIILQWL
jgi:hypothetical protein